MPTNDNSITIGSIGGSARPGYAPMSQGGGWLGSDEELLRANVQGGQPNTLLLRFANGGTSMMNVDQWVREQSSPRGQRGWDAIGDAVSIIGPDGRPMTIEQARQFVESRRGSGSGPGGPGAPGPGGPGAPGGPGYQGPPNRGIPDGPTPQTPPSHPGIRFNPITRPEGESPFQARPSPGGTRPDIPAFDAWSRIPDVVLPPTFDYNNPQHGFAGGSSGIVGNSVGGSWQQDPGGTWQWIPAQPGG
jgi:hypothetical protein